MSSSRFESITAMFTPQNIRTSFRRSSSSSSRRGNERNSYSSVRSMSPVGSSVNSIVLRQQSAVDLEEERKTFASELDILEPRPVVYWGSLEEQMGSL